MTCETCLKPEPLCICDAVEPVDNRVSVLILQHPQEQDKDLGTARLTCLQLRNAQLRIGLSWPSLRRILDRDVDLRRWGVLYLGSAKALPEGSDEEVIAVDKKGEPLPDQKAVLGRLEGIILLDGNWAQAKALWWRNAWLLKARRLVLNPKVRSKYGRVRKEPRRESLSTLEAAALTVARLEGAPDLFDRVTKPFRLLVDRYKAAQSKPASPKPASPKPDSRPEQD